MNARRHPLCAARKSRDVNRSLRGNEGRSMGKSVDIEPLFSGAEKHDGTMRNRLQKPDAPVSGGERAATLNILMAQYRRQCYRGGFIYVRTRGENRKEDRGRRAEGEAHEPLLPIAVQYPNWLEQQSDGACMEPYGRVQAAKRKPPFLRVAHASNKKNERCYRLGNIKSPLFVERRRARAGGAQSRDDITCPFRSHVKQ